MIRTFFEEIVFPVLLFLVLRLVLKGLFGKPRNAVQPYQGPPPRPPSGPVAELKKDPVCGAYVSTAGSVSRSIKGQVIYFCSAECRDKYVA
jgi:YHS domain-containing protein